jgi:hypothetical protein
MKNIMYVVFVMLMLGLTGCAMDQRNSYAQVKKAFPNDAMIEVNPCSDFQWFVKVGTNVYFVHNKGGFPVKTDEVQPLFNSAPIKR